MFMYGWYKFIYGICYMLYACVRAPGVWKCSGHCGDAQRFRMAALTGVLPHRQLVGLCTFGAYMVFHAVGPTHKSRIQNNMCWVSPKCVIACI